MRRTPYQAYRSECPAPGEVANFAAIAICNNRFGDFQTTLECGMLMFLAGVLDQMDLALEHIQRGGVHDARFGLMLTDNAVELVLHQIAKDQFERLKAYPYLEEKYERKTELEEAMGRSFEAKLRFARVEGQTSAEQSRTIAILHGFRNELYHLGLQYEPILSDISRFYFSTACRFIGDFKIRGFSYSSRTVLPERARKYFEPEDRFSLGRPEDFPKACRTLDERCAHKNTETIASLADHMERVIDDCDTCLDILADGIYDNQRKTRDQAIVDCQIWPLAFTELGRDFGKKKGWQGETIFEFVEWLAVNFPLKVKRDPVPSWRQQVKRLRSNGNPHTALANYQSFMNVTFPIRDTLLENAFQVEAEIDRLVHDSR